MTPHLVRWHNEFAREGLTIIEVDNGQIDSLEAVQEHVESQEIPFIVLHDEDEVVCKTYGVRGYPTAYLIDRTGKVVWEGHPAGATEVAEQRIREALAQ